jgi:hypothetical protein
VQSSAPEGGVKGSRGWQDLAMTNVWSDEWDSGPEEDWSGGRASSADLGQVTAQSRHPSQTGERLFVVHQLVEPADG